MKRTKKKAAREQRRRHLKMAESDKVIYRTLADKAYQGRISPVSKV